MTLRLVKIVNYKSGKQRIMQTFFQVIKDADSLKEACDKFKDEKYLGFDTETTALDPYEGEIRLVQLSNGQETIVVDMKYFRAMGDLKTLPALKPLRELLSANNRRRSRTTRSSTRNGFVIISERTRAEFSTRFSPANLSRRAIRTDDIISPESSNIFSIWNSTKPSRSAIGARI